MADQQYCLRWNNHQSTLISVFDSLQERGCMVDCTLAAEGQSLQAHKVVLSACSPYLEDLLSKHYDKHPILLLKDVKFEELKAMMDYMYRGEVNVAQDKLNTFLRAAESLQIKGLSDGGTDPPDSGGTTSTKRTAKGTPVSVRSNQLTVRKTNLDDSSSRDGSTSPSQRKRRRRRGSETSDIETSNVSDGKQSTAAAAPVSGPSETSPIVPASAPSDDNILSSITESAETENATDSGFSSAVPQEINNVIRDRDNALIEPKTEYVEDDGQDLNLEDEDGLFRAGPSHARGTYEGDGDDDVYMTNQDSGANAQEMDVKVVAELPVGPKAAVDVKTKDEEGAVAAGPVIASVGFVKDEVHDVTIKTEPKDEVIMDNGLPLPRPEENDDQVHDDVFGDNMDLSNDEGNDGEEQVRRSKRKFFCKKCPAHFKRPNHLKKHELVHKANKPFACPHCTASFPSETRLSHHLLVHSTASVFRCDKCGETFATATMLKEHMPTHTWKCPYCTSVFNTLHGLKIHVRTHNKTIDTFMCSECPASFPSKEELRAHKKATHPVAPPPPPALDTYECEYCDEKFTSTFDLLVHAKDHQDKDFPCEECPAQFDTRKERALHVQLHHPREVKCEKCDLTFASQSEMVTHLATHDIDDEHLRCEFCPKVFATNYHLLEHLHTHAERFECDSCQAEFVTRAQLELHAKTHTEGAFRCDDCGQRFVSKQQLTQHMKVHDNQKPFACDECPIRFKTESQLVKHQRITHKRASNINCSDCGAPFMNTFQLQEHLRLHHVKKTKAYWCEECVESFPTKALLEQHVRNHVDKNLFKCVDCPLKFATATGLEHHARLHKVENPYTCGYCEHTFISKDHLIRHMKSHKKK